MCLGKPRVDTAQMTVRESLAEGSRGTPFNTSSPRPPSLSLSPVRLSCPFSQSVFVSNAQVAASLSAIKTLYNQGGTVMGKEAYVRLVEHGKQQNPLLRISAAAGRVQQKNSPETSTVSNLNCENPSRQQV